MHTSASQAGLNLRVTAALGKGVGGGIAGSFVVKVMGLCPRRRPIWQAVTASCVHCSSGNKARPGDGGGWSGGLTPQGGRCRQAL